MKGFQTSSSSFSESLNSSETSFGDLSLNSSYEDYAEIETLTNSFDKLTNQFDDDKSAKVIPMRAMIHDSWTMFRYHNFIIFLEEEKRIPIQ